MYDGLSRFYIRQRLLLGEKIFLYILAPMKMGKNIGQIDPRLRPVAILPNMESEYFECPINGISLDTGPTIARAIPKMPKTAQPIKYIFSNDI